MKNSRMSGAFRGMKGLVYWSLCGALVSLAGIHSSAFAAKGGTPQASLALNGGDAEICYTNNTDWTISKTTGSSTVSNDTTSIDWTVNVVRGETGTDTIKGVGFLRVTNNGSATATVGNIVVNLQRRTIVGGKEKWVSAAADMMDATNGISTTSVKIVKAASQEVAPNNVNYTTDAGNTAVGIFTETLGSGDISLFDVNNNPIFSITPTFTIPAGGTVDFFYYATFDNSVLLIPGSELVRFEVIMTFGNAGGRGGSGAVTTNVDINGSGGLSPDEANVRSVPDRQTVTMPAQVTKCNDCVSVEDLTPTTSGTVTVTGFVEIKETICEDKTYNPVTAGITSDECGGSITNTATIVGVHTCNDSNSSCEVTLTTGTNTTKTFACCEDLKGDDSSTVTILAGANCGGGGQELECGQYSTFSQGGFGKDWDFVCDQRVRGTCVAGHFEPPTGGPGKLLADNFSTMFPSGLVVGSSTPCFKITLTSAQAVGDFLPTNGTPGALTVTLIDPTTSSAGVFAGQVVTLAINIALSDGGFTPALCDCDANPETPIGPSPKPYGDLVYCNGSGDALSGLTIRQILAVANNALGCGTLPTGYNFGSLTQLLDDLRGAFEPSSGVCQATTWAQEHLTLATSCP